MTKELPVYEVIVQPSNGLVYWSYETRAKYPELPAVRVTVDLRTKEVEEEGFLKYVLRDHMMKSIIEVLQPPSSGRIVVISSVGDKKPLWKRDREINRWY